MSRLGYAAGVQYELAYCAAVELLSERPAPERAIWSRTWAAEIARVADHFARLAGVAAAVEISAAEGAAQSGALATARLMAAVMGRGALAGWARIGGIETPLQLDSAERIAESIAAVERAISEFEVCGPRNPHFSQRLRGVGRLTPEEFFYDYLHRILPIKDSVKLRKEKIQTRWFTQTSDFVVRSRNTR